MNFNQLVALYEAKNEKPGQRYKSAMEREGPAGIVSGPIGKSDNFELRTPISKWDYDPSKDTAGKGGSGFSAESKIWRSMLNSFGLLFNDKDFDKRIQKIAKTFNDSRDSYKLSRMGEEGMEKYDEEAQLEKLERNRASYQSKITGLEQDIKTASKALNHTKISPSEKNAIELKIKQLEASIPIVNKHLKETENAATKQKYTDQREDIIARLTRLREKYDNATMNKSSIESLKSSLFDLAAKLEQYQEKYDDTLAELDTLHERINGINAANEKANKIALDAFTNYMKYAAEDILIGMQAQAAEEQGTLYPEDVDWEALPDSYQTKASMLKALASTDPQVNPILGYLERFKREYADKGYDDREMNANVNITKMRDFNRLPFMTLLRIYNSIRSAVKKPIPLESLDVDNHNFYYSALVDDLRGVKTAAEWEGEPFKNRVRDAINGLAITQNNKDLLLNDVNDPWIVNPRTKLTANKKMEARLKSMSAEQGLKKENYTFEDELYSIMEEYAIDIDDHTLDMVELEALLEAKCTKATKKASSDRDGKKWMQCVKDPDGSGYKKIHWGQEGVRATGDSGDTKRKKSFRARHKCSTAKPGTAKHQACKDW